MDFEKPWFPDTINEAALIVASFPGVQKFDRAVIAADNMISTQNILGSAAQLQLFLRLMAQLRRRVFIVAAPEIFGTDESLRQLWRLAERNDQAHEIVHFRFGPNRDARVFKRAKNIMVSAERHVWRDPIAAWHPLAGGQILPAAFCLTLALHSRTSQTRYVDGSRCETRLLCPLPDGPAPVPKGRNPGILVPWNMAFPGSMIPDLAVRLAGQSQKMPITLLPYNWKPDLDYLLQELRRQMNVAAPDHQIRIVPVAPIDPSSLAETHALAWLEEADPEYHWTRTRLAALHIPSAVIRCRRAKPLAEADCFAVVADRAVLYPAPDATRVVNTLSNAATQRLLAKSSRELARSAA